jgi:hypothetical protein
MKLTESRLRQIIRQELRESMTSMTKEEAINNLDEARRLVDLVNTHLYNNTITGLTLAPEHELVMRIDQVVDDLYMSMNDLSDPEL